MFVAKPILVAAWRVPPLGTCADEDVPAWLLTLFQDGTVGTNHLGGLSAVDAFGTRGCYPGDYVVKRADGSIDFCPEELFAGRYERIEEKLAA